MPKEKAEKKEASSFRPSAGGGLAGKAKEAIRRFFARSGNEAAPAPEKKRDGLPGRRPNAAAKAREAVRRFFCRPSPPAPAAEAFSRFGAKEYIETYYPPIADIEAMARTIRQAGENLARNNGRADLARIKNELELTSEAAENLFIFDFLQTVVKRMIREFPEDHIRVLDVGGGPTIYQHIALSLWADQIHHTDFLEQNRIEIKKWVQGQADGYDWDSYFLLMQELLQNDSEFTGLLRASQKGGRTETELAAARAESLLAAGLAGQKENLKMILDDRVAFADVFREGLGLEDGQAYELVTAGRENAIEIVTSNFTVESATGKREDWEKGMRHVMSRVKDGGFLALTAIRNAEWYLVGRERMPAVRVNENDIEKIIAENGFHVVELRVISGSNREKDGYDGMVFVLAQKTG